MRGHYKRHKLVAHDRTEKMNPAFHPNLSRRYVRKRKRSKAKPKT